MGAAAVAGEQREERGHKQSVIVEVWNETKNTLVCRRCFVATRWWQRLKGLIGHSALAEDEGLLLRPAFGGIHTCFLRFAIDVAYLDEEGQVVAIRPHLPPWRFWLVWQREAVMALELPAGRLQATQTEIGDRFVLRPSQVGSP